MARMTLRRSQARKIPRTLSTLLFALLAVSSVMLTSSLAVADEHADARALYQKGNTAFASGDDVMARHHYQKSLEKAESFDTMCNLGRTEARMKLFAEAYEHLRMCVWLYPKDEELAEAKAKFSELRDEVRKELTFEDADVVEDRVEAEIARREEIEAVPAPQSGLEEKSAVESADSVRTWKLPVVVSLAGLGVASGVFGGVMFASSAGPKKEANALKDGLPSDACAGSGASPDCEEIDSLLKKSDSKFNAGTIGVIGAGTFLVSAALVQFLVPRERASSAGVSGSIVGVGRVRGVPFADYNPHTDGFRFGVSGSF